MGSGEVPNLDANELYVDTDALTTVAGHFETLATNLDKLRQDLRDFKADLGMNEAEEGRSWNEKVNEDAKKMYDAIGVFGDRATEFKQKTEAAKLAYQNLEAQNKKRFESGELQGGADRDTGMPPRYEQTFEI